ncbi:MAG TPA: SDR family oxidoreductase [Candidatus Competibacteraceae bacterium]|nr:SDR family oxidoreductase [Candidatus Competibacteraceae bacterium]
MARILIAGCGDVGTTLGLLLQQAGHEVWGLKRHPATLPPAIRGLSADLSDPASLQNRLPPDLNYVFYTTAADGFSEAHYRAAYVDGVTHLLDALQADGQQPRRLFFTSSTSVYAQCHGEWVDEDSSAEATGFAGRCLRQGEELLWNGPYPASVIRFGGIYGPGRTRLIDSLRQGNATCVDNPPLYTNRIHRNDCAAALQHLMNLSAPAALYLGVDNEPAPQCEVLRWLAGRLGVPGPTVVSAATAPEAMLRANKRCRNTRLRASGFQFRYPSYREGYAALLE